ncbi:uroporphyrinogen-III C-methyltransferase [Gramella jeungdoensis]|uniref:uroporphyrinogen-III C-methyltransferase n=1 Tax=Gramella jeungdoensis TaxID=708091 RepID=A0ABT0Z2T6_9FLAO|nr:uroporphyrinogen-III C-methyltransferase [Gramella jeungdoensis]MCM8569099.1 uroporphyrinogen-III C-methyltransferase [Gramella jeungdoensis]
MKDTVRKFPKVSLVGAGPGDPELLTLKAVKALENADAVLYDALVNPEILNHAPNAVKLFVGKRKGCHSYSQDQINELLVKHALQYGHVVRLKGGDPFVFGRGSEEIAHLSHFGISTEVVPGISSALAVPAYKGIPVTHRRVAESFWVITGTTSSRHLSDDIRLAARSSATVVILMGMSKLSQIVSIFKGEGKNDTPISVIQNGTREDEKSCIGKISNIEELVAEQKLSSPAIIIIGEVVEISKNGMNDLLSDEFIFQNLGIEAIPA